MLKTAAMTTVITTKSVMISTVIKSLIKVAKKATGTVVSPSMFSGMRNMNIPIRDGIKNFKKVVVFFIS